MALSAPAFPTESQVPPASTPRPTRAAPAEGGGFHPFGRDGFSFWDLLDIINPLQHVPVISTLYRRITGDVIDPLPRVAGGVLFGGFVGGISSLANVAVKEGTGRDIGGHVLALVEDGLGLSDDSSAPDTGIMVASGPKSGPAAAEPVATVDPALHAPAAAQAVGAEDGTTVAAAEPAMQSAQPRAGASWRAAFAADFYDAEAFDPKRSLIDVPTKSAPPTAVADAGAVAGTAAHAAASASYTQAPSARSEGNRLNLVG